jgi:2-polyprenyl-6-methoxyphenol hydroxylase-like FAD-dependent oxidoreductase
MGRIVVCGGGIIGLSAAMMLGADGHRVTVLEGDPDGAPAGPAQAWTSWLRRGVAQFHQPHVLLTRCRQVYDQELPGMSQRMLDNGCTRVDYLDPLPPTLTDRARRPGDDALQLVTGRRPVVEAVVAAAAEQDPVVEVRRGVRVADLLAGPSAIAGVPHVVGVRTTAGERIPADLVVDATGRRTRSGAWLAGIGAPPALETSKDRGFVYYTRYFSGPRRPARRARPLTPLGSISLLTLDGDNDTWSVTVFGLSGDAPLKALRDPDTFTAVVSAYPMHAQWLDGSPISDVVAMAGILDRYHRFVVDGQPVVTGFAAVGDAWACTNPSVGRGVSIGLMHAQQLRRTVRGWLDDPVGLAKEWDAVTESVVAPHYRNQVAADRARFAEMEALCAGRPAPPPDPLLGRLLAASVVDADAFRATLEMNVCMALPDEVLARPAIVAALDRLDPDPAPAAASGPDREQLLTLLAG